MDTRPLKLPTVTLASIETRHHDLLAATFADAMSKAEFGAVLIMTNDRTPFSSLPNCSFVEIADAATKFDWEEQFWNDLPAHIATEHVLFMEWDAGVLDRTCWTDDFLAFDYIGAPWPWCHDRLNVGNGGFSLISTRLKRHLANNPRYPCADPADLILSRNYRHALEAEGFCWAPEELAHRFAFECAPPRASFGFHAMRNWVHVFDPPTIISRARMAARYPYICGPSHLGQLLEAAPWLKQEIGLTSL